MFDYGPNQERVRMQVYRNDTLQYTRYYFGSYGLTEYPDESYEKDTWFAAEGGIFGFHRETASADSVYYVIKDHLGSVMTIAAEDGHAREYLSYDPWGKRRNPADWTCDSTLTVQFTSRGYTGHEHIDETCLINMNGRVYDPLVGLFISPDPLIQEPFNPLSYNRYSYVQNNPLQYTDPSGYLYEWDWSMIEREEDGGGSGGGGLLYFDPWYGYARSYSQSIGNLHSNPYEWSYDGYTQTYWNHRTWETKSTEEFSTQNLPQYGRKLSPKSTQAVIDGLNSLLSETNKMRSWNDPLVMVRGFDGHIFQYDRETGLFYAPWTDIVVDPLAILVQSLEYASNTGIGPNLSFNNPDAFTHISESSTTITYGITPYIVHQTTAAGHIKGNGPTRIKNGVVLNDVVSRKGPFYVKAKDNGWMIGAGNFSFGLTDGMFTTSYRSTSDGYAGWDSQYFSVTNQYQLNWRQIGYIAAVAAFPALLEATGIYLIPAF
jgi:RHS repeat-associated protein